MADASAAGAAEAGYRVLARKYRPRTFDDLIGQDAMVRTLSNAFETGRIAQAYMLTGVRGVGKTTTARILARALNYAGADGAGKPTIRMPELGLHCQAIIEGRHVDVQEMDAASHTSINDIREIIEAARYKPMSARYKVYIIDEVHMLSTAAFNGLLKTLEEPPEHVKFVFATTEIRKVPVTVLSRCQRFDLRRVEGQLLADHLIKVATAEAVALAPDAAALIARAAEGSVRDALSILDQAIAHGGAAVEADVLRTMLGLADRGRIYDLLGHVMRGAAAEALTLFDTLYAEGADPAVVIAELAEIVHAVTRAKVAPEATGTLGLPEMEARRAAEYAGGLSMRVLARAWAMLLKGHGEVAGAPRPASAAEMLLVRLCHVAELPTPDELIRRIEGGDVSAPARTPPRPSGAGAQAGPRLAAETAAPMAPAPMAAAQPARAAPVAQTAQAAPAAPFATVAPGAPVAPVVLARFEDLVALAAVKRDIPFKIALERQVRLVSFERGRIALALAEGAPNGLVTELQRKLHEWTGERWMVTLAREGGQATLAEAADERQKSLVDDVRADPAVAAILRRFPGAQIVDVRVVGEEPPLEDPTAGLEPDDDF